MPKPFYSYASAKISKKRLRLLAHAQAQAIAEAELAGRPPAPQGYRDGLNRAQRRAVKADRVKRGLDKTS